MVCWRMNAPTASTCKEKAIAMRDLLPIFALLAAMVLAAFTPSLLHGWRRRHWRRVEARIDAAYYVTPGKTSIPMVDISYCENGRMRSINGLRYPALHIEDLTKGDRIMILVSPSDSCRCVIDD